MIKINVQLPGLFTTVQDLGREGFASMGVSACGAADSVALRLGNRLVGNSEGAAALEMALLGGAFRFSEGAVVAVTGSDFGATLAGVPVEMWTSIAVQPEQVLAFGATRTGARCYLCVRGGIAVRPFLGSAATHVLSGLGGMDGRALRKGAVLEIGQTAGEQNGATQPPRAPFRGRAVAPRTLQMLAPRKVLRVTAGPQSDWFPESSQTLLYSNTFRVAEESDRMGVRLAGTHIPAPGREMITEGVPLGAIQVPPGGAPIIIFVDQQTTGGYPTIANIISADMSCVGQLRPRDEIRFVRVEIEAARLMLREQEELLVSEDLLQT